MAMTRGMQIILDTTAEAYGLEPDTILFSTHEHQVSHPRQVAQYLCRKLLRSSFPALAKGFNAHHTTIMWSCRAVDKRIDKCQEEITSIEAECVKNLRNANVVILKARYGTSDAGTEAAR